jgi:hypothetical protein
VRGYGDAKGRREDGDLAAALVASRRSAELEHRRRELEQVLEYDAQTGLGSSRGGRRRGGGELLTDDGIREAEATSSGLGQLLAGAATAAARGRSEPATTNRGGSWDVGKLLRDSAEDNGRSAKRYKNLEVVSSSDEEVFQSAPAAGSRYIAGLRAVSEQLGARDGGRMGEIPRVTSWLHSIYFGQNSPASIGRRNAAELRLLASALDMLGSGDLPALGDLLIQRVKAIQVAVADGSWATAGELDPTPLSTTLLASDSEQQKAARNRLLKMKLEAAKSKASEADARDS